jgi:phage repressor protein C with HTH and peptisase S24 domain
MALGERVKALRLERGLTQAELGNLSGVSQQTIDAIESGRSLRPRNAPEIAAALGTSIAALMSDDESAPPTLKHHRLKAEAGALRVEGPPAALIHDMPRDVPVLGQAVGGEEADFRFNGETIDYIRRPPGLRLMRDVFAIYVTGTSMWPRFDEGEPVYASSSRLPANGDYVIVELHPEEEGGAGRSFIKRLARRTPTLIICEQFNPATEIEFGRNEVKALYRIIPMSELVGI